MMVAMRWESPVSDASAMSRTALVRKPSEVPERSMSMAELKMLKSPIPAGPIQMATSLLSATEQRLLITCTPPNNFMARSTVRDMLTFPSLT